MRKGLGGGRSRTVLIRYQEFIARKGGGGDVTVFESSVDGRDGCVSDKGVLGQVRDGAAGGDGDVVRGEEGGPIGEAEEPETRPNGLHGVLEDAKYHSFLVCRRHCLPCRSYNRIKLLENLMQESRQGFTTPRSQSTR